MKESSSIFTRTRMGLDTRVWLTLITVMCLSCLLLGFRLLTKVPCTPIKIDVKGYSNTKPNSYFMGAKVTFTATMKGGNDVVWDFGDHSAKANGGIVEHTFMNEGNYIVTATVNDKCVESVNINIAQLPRQEVEINNVVSDNPITGQDAPTALTPVNYTCSATAGSYEWSVVNSPDFPTQKGNTATFTFPSEGARIIELKLDNDPSKVYRKTIQVLPSPKLMDNPGQNNNINNPPPVVAAPPPAEKAEVKETGPKVLVVPDEEFKNMFDQVADGKKDALAFNQFLCSGIQTKVLANDTEWETVASFCSKIYNHKKVSIKSVSTVRDEKKCVTILKVNYKKRWL